MACTAESQARRRHSEIGTLHQSIELQADLYRWTTKHPGCVLQRAGESPAGSPEAKAGGSGSSSSPGASSAGSAPPSEEALEARILARVAALCSWQAPNGAGDPP